MKGVFLWLGFENFWAIEASEAFRNAEWNLISYSSDVDWNLLVGNQGQIWLQKVDSTFLNDEVFTELLKLKK